MLFADRNRTNRSFDMRREISEAIVSVIDDGQADHEDVERGKASGSRYTRVENTRCDFKWLNDDETRLKHRKSQAINYCALRADAFEHPAYSYRVESITCSTNGRVNLLTDSATRTATVPTC